MTRNVSNAPAVGLPDVTYVTQVTNAPALGLVDVACVTCVTCVTYVTQVTHAPALGLADVAEPEHEILIDEGTEEGRGEHATPKLVRLGVACHP